MLDNKYILEQKTRAKGLLLAEEIVAIQLKELLFEGDRVSLISESFTENILEETFLTCELDLEGLYSEECSPFACVKIFSEIREGKTVESSLAKIKTSFSLEFNSLEQIQMIFQEWKRC